MLVSTMSVALWVQAPIAGTIEGKVSAAKMKYLPYTVVFVDSVEGVFEPPKEHVVMDQKNLVFTPHVLPVLAGTTVDFLNSDDVAHNVFTPDKAAGKFNLGTWPQGETRSHKFEKRCDKVCDAVMLCKVHPEMEAFVTIMENPFFATADDSGYFAIPDVPAGQRTVRIWHPRLTSEGQVIEVPDSGTVVLEFKLEKKKKKK